MSKRGRWTTRKDEKIEDTIAKRLDDKEATRIAEHLEKGEDWGDDHLEAFAYQQMHDFWKRDHRDDVRVTAPEDTSFPDFDKQEADAAAEHYFWCMLGLPGMERGLKQLDTVPPPVPPSKAPPPTPPSKARPLFPPRRLTPAPSRSPTRLRSRTRFGHGRFRRRRLRSPTRPRSRTRLRSPTRLRRHPVKRRERPATEMLPEKIRPERPATEMLLEKIRGSMQGLLERNWVEEFHDHYPIRQNLDAKMIEVIHEEKSRQRPIVIDFFPVSPRYALVLGSLDSAHPDCDIFHWKDAPAPLACKFCLSAGTEVRKMLSRFLQNKYHATWDPSENPQAWEGNLRHQDNVMVRHIRHSHDTVSPVFEHGKHRGKHVKDLVNDMLSGKVHPQDLTPFVCIKFGKEEYWAVFGNRRLKALKSFQDEVDHDVKARCLVWSKDEAPAALACKLAMSATTKNNGAFADFKGKGKGKGKRREP